MLNNERGFTLIELIIVVILIGILATIAIPKFRGSKENAYVGTMKADLRNLAMKEEAYLFQNGVYSTDLAVLGATLSQGVTLIIAEATASGWSASASHTSSARTCGLYHGSAAPVAPAISEGELACTTP